MSNAAYSFTQDDRMNPVFCIGCRQHIPVAVSNAGRGLCPDCLGRLQQAQPAPSVAPPAVHTPYAHPAVPAPQPNQPWYAGILTPHQPQMVPGQFGHCPQCRSPYVAEFANYAQNGSATGLRSGGCLLLLVGVLTICLGVGPFLIVLGFILWIVGACLPSRTQTSTSRGCHSCGFRWQV